jgi:hypothetical protein
MSATMKRERAKVTLHLKAGILRESPIVAAGLAEWSGDETNPERVPVVCRDSSGVWRWYGFRRLVNGGSRVTIDGKQQQAEPRVMEFERSKEKRVWVVDLAATVSDPLRLKLPLETAEHLQDYKAAGVELLTPASRIMSIMGWKGGEGRAAAEGLKIYMRGLARGYSAETLAKIKKTHLENVGFPSPTEHALRVTGWNEALNITFETRDKVKEMDAKLGELSRWFDPTRENQALGAMRRMLDDERRARKSLEDRLANIEAMVSGLMDERI